jgi:thiol:disulfide interchange protein DsbC
MRLNFVFFPLLLGMTIGAAYADEASLRKALLADFPGEKIESIKKTPYLGLYEVVVGDDLFYTDENATFLFLGHVIDPKTKQSLTSERLQEIKDARRISMDELPLDLSIKAVRGNGKRKLVVFSDPKCPYCKRLEKELAKVTDITIYTLLYPVLNGSLPVAASIWCSADRLKAWDDFMLRGIAPSGKNCETPISTLVQTGQKYRINGTPTLIFADGSVVPGMITAEAIEKKLGAAPPKQ